MNKTYIIIGAMLFIRTSFADTETMNWYVDGSVYDTTTCQSGADVVLPSAPTKDGYTFSGWVSGFYDFSTLDPTINGKSTTAISTGLGGSWSVLFSYGNIYGLSKCADTGGSARGETGNPSTSTSNGSAKYCWCRVTGLQSDGNDFIYEPVSDLPWVYNTYEANYCSAYCTRFCMQTFNSDADFRRVAFGITQ